MRPPLAGKRAAARRLAARLRLVAVERVSPLRSDALQPPPVDRSAAAVAPQGPTPDDAAARIDAARARLRASIQAPDDPDA